ncbi:MAG: hydantoinase/oxoprolinase family protein [Acidimicrobiia bacterium]|nr:hydantoinase/oxoprolinase family protein [Acidimicrobiia bacterium]
MTRVVDVSRVGVDTGGTFTDLVAADGTIAKVPSTPADPAEAVARGLAELVGEGGSPEVLCHGTTVATNALLERRGAEVTLVTTRGLADVIEIARQDRPSLYDIWADRPPPLVSRARRLEVGGRLAADGTELEPVGSIDELDLSSLEGGGDGAVAVCLLHADLDPSHERAVAGELSARGFDVSCSHVVSPQFREYERTVTTVVNAYLRPRCRAYLDALSPLAAEVLVMTSAGGLVPVDAAAELPARLLLSGPAGGVRAAAEIAAANGFADAITFDMGGTSTDVCLVLGGRPEPAGDRSVSGYPIRLPSLDVHTIGAGGGSIARLDAGGALVVGPESAGAVPGPACYGLGGHLPTVTDADVVAERLTPGVELPGIGELRVDLARAALDRAGVTAEGVIAVVEAAMEQALRTVSVARGVDPQHLALVAFGGAGPMHACGLADALGMPAVIIPPRAGVLSAVGLLCGPRQHDLVRSWPTPSDHTGVTAALAALAAECTVAVGGAGPELETAVDCRYAGQSHEITVPSVDAFADEHWRRNGYDRPDTPIEVVALRATARRSAPLAVTDLPDIDRTWLRGGMVAQEPDCTVHLPSGWRADPGEAGALVLRRDP